MFGFFSCAKDGVDSAVRKRMLKIARSTRSLIMIVSPFEIECRVKMSSDAG
jgi:hypothetical protein